MKPSILFVDDDSRILEAIGRALRAHRNEWDMTYTTDSEEAWQFLLERPIDLVVADIRMPGIDGLELLDRIVTTPATQQVAVVMLTGLPDRSLKREALDRGAVDLLNKPFEPEDLLARIRASLRLKSYEDQLQLHNRQLEQCVRERTDDLFHSRLDIVWRLGKAAEHRDEATGHHVIRVGCISRIVATALGLSRDEIDMIFVAAPLHDIGKIGVADAILKKPGPLSPGEWVAMRQHCLIGARILRDDSQLLRPYCDWRGWPLVDSRRHLDNPLLDAAATIAMTHHEKWDGTGYPQQLAGEDIPLSGRIVAIADVFDALTSRRPYKPIMPDAEALHILADGRGTHFDPQVYDAFVEQWPAIQDARRQFADGHPSHNTQQGCDETYSLCR